MKAILSHVVSLFTALGLMLFVSACNAKDSALQTKLKKERSYLRTVKPHAPVFMEYQLPPTIEANQPITVDITIMSGQKIGKLVVGLRAGEGLQSADALERQFGTQQAGQKNSFPFIVQAAEEGRYRVYVTASLINGDTTQSRSFIIPVNVGKLTAAPKLKAMGVVVEDEVGEKIISMPATEAP